MTRWTRSTPDARVLTSGIAWIGTFRWSAQILNWLSTLIVIRLLTPQDYGIVGMAAVFIGVAAVLSEFGLGSAVVALPALDSREVSQLNGAALLLGVGMAVIANLCAPALASFFGQPALRLVVPALSLGFILEGARTVPVAMLSRQLAYRTTALLDFGRQATAALVVLSLAWSGAGYWSLVGGNLAGSLVATLWVLAWHRQPMAAPRVAELERPITYSRHLLGGRVAWQMYRNSDFLVAGRMLGVDLLGVYTVAWNLASLPGEKLGNIITAATGPFFSALQHDRAALRHHFLKVTELLALVLLPILIGFLLVADLAVPLILGDRWLPAVAPLRALIGYAAIQSVVTPAGQLLNVTGNTRVGMRAGGLALLVLPPAFFLGARLGGVTGIAMAWLITYPILTIYPMRYVHRALELSVPQYLGAWRRAVEGVAWISVAVIATRLVTPVETARWVQLAMLVAVGVAAFGACLLIRHRPVLTQLAGLLRRGRPHAGEAPVSN